VRVPWKLIGVAGLAGVAASGVVIARKRRSHREFDPDELRSRLHRRLSEVRDADEGADASAGDPSIPSEG
jgi:hypothetical protein